MLGEKLKKSNEMEWYRPARGRHQDPILQDHRLPVPQGGLVRIVRNLHVRIPPLGGVGDVLNGHSDGGGQEIQHLTQGRGTIDPAHTNSLRYHGTLLVGQHGHEGEGGHRHHKHNSDERIEQTASLKPSTLLMVGLPKVGLPD